MAPRVRLFISAGPDQDPAREAVGLAMAAYPINVGWVIKRTPDVDSVAESHSFLVLHGADITAPVGLELYWARRTEKPIFAYRRDVSRTPAGQVFVQENGDLEWRRFVDLTVLRRQVMTDLSRYLLTHAERYELTLVEVQRLHLYIAAQEKAAASAAADVTVGAKAGESVQPKPGAAVSGAAAGGGGVILAPGKDQPVGARLVGQQG